MRAREGEKKNPHLIQNAYYIYVLGKKRYVQTLIHIIHILGHAKTARWLETCVGLTHSLKTPIVGTLYHFDHDFESLLYEMDRWCLI